MPTRIPVLGPQVPLRELRKALGLTLAELATLIRDYGYHRAPTEGTLANVELGRQAGSRKLMTAWAMALRLPPLIGRLPRLVALPASSAPAFGSAKVHAATHRELIEKAIVAEG